MSELVGLLDELLGTWNLETPSVHLLHDALTRCRDELTKQAEHLAECIRSHQKVNAEVEELEAKLDKQSERVRELEAATWRLIEAASRVVNLHEKNLPIYDSEFNELARRVMYAVQAMPTKWTDQ